MMKYKVKTSFTDKYTREKIKEGSVLEIEPSRVRELNDKNIGHIKMTKKELIEECEKRNVQFESSASAEDLIALLLQKD